MVSRNYSAALAPPIIRSGAELNQLFTHSDIGEFTNEPKNAQKPQNHDNDDDRIQDRLNGARHWDVWIDKPKNHTNYD